MTSAHIFYIPVLILVGFFAGYFVGRQSAEADEAAARKRRARREKARSVAQASSSGDEVDGGSES